MSDQEVFEYRYARIKLYQFEHEMAFGAVIIAIGTASMAVTQNFFIIATIQLLGWYWMLKAFLACGALRRDGLARKIWERTHCEIPHPPLEGWYQSLKERDAFTDYSIED